MQPGFYASCDCGERRWQGARYDSHRSRFRLSHFVGDLPVSIDGAGAVGSEETQTTRMPASRAVCGVTVCLEAPEAPHCGFLGCEPYYGLTGAIVVQ